MTESIQKESNKHFDLQRIFLKDVSFETPNSPAIFLQEWKPAINLEVGSEAKALAEGVYEVVLKITVTCRVAETVAFLAEVQQAGIFSIQGFSDQELPHMLGSYCPGILYPYVREVVSDLVTKGSFPQFLLAPINFDAMLAQNLKSSAATDQTH